MSNPYKEQEQKLFEKYGKLPKRNPLSRALQERKYFDSGDYALSKAGVESEQAVGKAIPSPQSIPHPAPGSASPDSSADASSSPRATSYLPDDK